VRVHFLTSHPKDLSDQIIETAAELPFVAKEFLLPLQSGDDEILMRMNRGYSLHYYIDRVNKVRALMPNARIMTDIMVGFPGETEAQFENTLKAVKQIKFNHVHMFAYSARTGTAAAKMPGQLSEEVKHVRLMQLISLNRQLI
jgi:tRNA-2-methylthio-N6-dimethylallyladenosine synthase